MVVPSGAGADLCERPLAQRAQARESDLLALPGVSFIPQAAEMFKVSRGLQLQSRWVIPAAAVS